MAEKELEKQYGNFTDMPVWQRAHLLVLAVYALSDNFPKKETFALSDQIRRAVISITSNIAEGYGRRGFKDNCWFYTIAFGSLREVQNQIIIAKDLGYIKEADSTKLMIEAEEVVRLIYKLIANVKKRKSAAPINY